MQDRGADRRPSRCPVADRRRGGRGTNRARPPAGVRTRGRATPPR